MSTIPDLARTCMRDLTASPFGTSPSMLPVSSDTGAGEEGSFGGQCRTRGILVIARINGKAPEQGCSGAFRANPYNQSASGSGLGCIGSPAGAHGRMRVSLQFPVMMEFGNGRCASSTPPQATPKESPADRAARFRELLNSGKYRSQSELARALGCSQPWISKALRKSS